MFEEIEKSNWNELKEFLATLNSNWVFRGQADYTWKLESSIDRTNFNNEINFQKKMFEDYFIRDFKRLPHLYSNKYSVHSDFQILSTLQHYGLPTRLLDFSKSPYVAAFFATLNSSIDSSIFAMNYMELASSTSHLFSLNYSDDPVVQEYSQGIPISDDAIFQKLVLSKKQIPFVELVQPFFQFDRMIQQSGCFLCQGDINSDFELNLQANHTILQNMPNCNPYYKLKIKKEWKQVVIRDLERMNINSASLFPGMEGYLKSVKNQFDIKIADTKDRIINDYG